MLSKKPTLCGLILGAVKTDTKHIKMLTKVTIWAFILATRRAERSRVRVPAGSRDSFSKTCRPGRGPSPTGVLSRGQSDQGVKLTNHLYLEFNEQLYFCLSCTPACSGQGIYLYLHWHLFHRDSWEPKTILPPLTVLQTKIQTSHVKTHTHTEVKNTETGTNQLREN